MIPLSTPPLPPPARPSAPPPSRTFGGMIPFLPPTGAQVHPSAPGLVRPVSSPLAARSAIHFLVHSEMPELLEAARRLGWFERGWTVLSIRWQELVYSTDLWRTTRVLRSSDVPCPVMSGHFFLPGVPPRTEVHFALHVGFACHAPADLAGVREESDAWLNNAGRNYVQLTK